MLSPVYLCLVIILNEIHKQYTKQAYSGKLQQGPQTPSSQVTKNTHPTTDYFTLHPN